MAGLLDNLASHWACETGPGSLADEQGNKLLFQQVGGQVIAAGKIGNCVDIPKFSYYIANGSTGNYDLRQATAPTFTIGMWVRIDTLSAANHCIFEQWDGGASEEGLYVDLVTSGGSGTHRWRIVCVDALGAGYGLAQNVADVAAGAWHYVLFGNDAGTLFISADGAAPDTRTWPNTFRTTGSPDFTIGGWVANNLEWTDGDLDEISFWRPRALTAGWEAAWLYHGGAGRNFSEFGRAGPPGSNVAKNLKRRGRGFPGR